MEDLLFSIDAHIDTQASLIAGIKADFSKVRKGNKSAITRVRLAEVNLAKVAKETRVLLLELKKL